MTKHYPGLDVLNFRLATHTRRSAPSSHEGYGQEKPGPELPAFFPYLGKAGPVPGYTHCEPVESTPEKAQMPDFVRYVRNHETGKLRHLLRSAKGLTQYPAGWSLNRSEDIVLFFTASNPDGSRTGRYDMPEGVELDVMLQRGNRLAISVNISEPSIIIPSLNFSNPALFRFEFNWRHEIEHIWLNVGSYQYASLQDPPNLERGAYITDNSPPEWRPYDRCRGVPGRCEGYNEPCPEDTNGLIYNEVNYLLNNLTATPNLTQLETFYDVTAINNSLSWLRSLARVPMVGRS